MRGRYAVRILNVTQCCYPFVDKGGRPWKVRALSRELAAAGYAVSIVTGDLGLARGFAKALPTTPAPDDSLRIRAVDIWQDPPQSWAPPAGAMRRQASAQYNIDITRWLIRFILSHLLAGRTGR
jgi:hypothetical protein